MAGNLEETVLVGLRSNTHHGAHLDNQLFGQGYYN
jgi:hypothetical protein